MTIIVDNSTLRSVYRERLYRFCKKVEEHGLEGSIVNGSSNITFFIGIETQGLLEIDCVATTAKLYVTLLDYYRIMDYDLFEGDLIAVTKNLPPPKDVDQHIFTDFENIVKSCSEKALGVAGTRKISKCRDLSNILAMVRREKTLKEIEVFRSLTSATERILRSILDELTNNHSQITTSSLWLFLVKQAHALTDGPSFPPIVATEKTSYYPHPPVKVDVPLERASVLLIDYGLRLGGFSTDMTRTIILRNEGRVREQLELVEIALHDAVDHLISGVPAGAPDSAARMTLSLAGLDRYFIHSLGHGIGVEVHEPPRLSIASSDFLQKGDLVTVEPGVYFKGSYGLRVENMYFIKNDKAQGLNRLETIIDFKK